MCFEKYLVSLENGMEKYGLGDTILILGDRYLPFSCHSSYFMTASEQHPIPDTPLVVHTLDSRASHRINKNRLLACLLDFCNSLRQGQGQ